jgi:NAD(P)-dependent dehydrogenase (short-subunit alcohol dehydrogenase family)
VNLAGFFHMTQLVVHQMLRQRAGHIVDITASIRINAMAPRVIYKPRYGLASYKGMAEEHPLGRLGQISDVVDHILYLERASFVTGVVLHIDGGQATGG